MNYRKLFLPIPIALILTSLVPILEISCPGYSLIIGIIIIGAVLIYYLRLGNNGSPLLNTLTLMLLVIFAGEYYIKEKFTLGIALIISGNLAFGLTFVFRQKLKSKKDKHSGLKATAVFAFGLSMIFSFAIDSPAILVIGNLILIGVYFYDRLIQISEQRK